jgi:geranylgeranyl pyrophosphate synthase
MAVDTRLQDILALVRPDLERVAATVRSAAEVEYPLLGAVLGDIVGAGGKRLRPMMVFLCAAERAETAIPAAVAVELLHMATLVHDDVLDGATLRRGRPTVFAEGGRGAATATGDLLFSRAFAELAGAADAEAVRALSAASSALARGELMQRADAWSESVSPERYLERCRLKTASLFEASCRLGAHLGGRPPLAHALGRFGARVGLAFQLLDDVLDVSGPTERTGKPRGADLLDGTVTLPLILARRVDPELRDLDLREVVTGPAQAAAVCDRIALSGALGEARRRALAEVAEAKAALTAVELPGDRRRALELVADGVVERYA